MRTLLPCLVAFTLAACGAPAASGAAPITFEDYDARSVLSDTRPARTVPYGPAPSQQADLWLPSGSGKAPVVILIHGGCWSARLSGREQTAGIASDLARRGYAVWSIGYRRPGEPGGGYPGTFQDVAAGIDAVRGQSARLDLDHVVVVGHSAGGHLAAWAAARRVLPPESPLRTADPLPIRGVVALAPILDLKAQRPNGPKFCGFDAISPLLGEPSPARPDLYADTSPAALVPTGIPLTVVSGDQDFLTGNAAESVRNATAAGDRARIVIARDAGHFEVVAQWTPVWDRVVAEIERLIR